MGFNSGFKGLKSAKFTLQTDVAKMKKVSICRLFQGASLGFVPGELDTKPRETNVNPLHTLLLLPICSKRLIYLHRTHLECTA